MVHLYGDLVNGVSFTAALPFYIYMAWQDEDPVVQHGPLSVCGCFVWTVLFAWLSYTKQSVDYSLLSYSGSIAALITINVCQWPHPGQCTVIPQLLWQLLINSANTAWSFRIMLVTGFLAFCAAIGVAAQSHLTTVGKDFPAMFVTFGTL